MKPADLRSHESTSRRSAETIESEAADWLALKEYRPMTSSEQGEFKAWLAADPRHGTAVADLEAAWADMNGLAAYPRPVGASANPDFFTQAPRSRAKQWLLLGAAAAIVCAFFLRFNTWQHPSTSATVAGSAMQQNVAGIIRLSDGSLVELRAGSEVKEQFTATERRVRLVRGEAYFSVAKNSARPFIVDANGVAVRAVGTAFNVRLDTGSVMVLVTEGKVKVNSSGAPAHGSSAAPVSEVQLDARQRVVVSMVDAGSPVSSVVETVSASEVKQVLAWQTSNLVFDATPLSQVIVQFNRCNVRQLVIAEPDLGSLRISGRFRADSLDGFAELLESSFGVVVTHQGNDLLLSKRP